MGVTKYYYGEDARSERQLKLKETKIFLKHGFEENEIARFYGVSSDTAKKYIKDSKNYPDNSIIEQETEKIMKNHNCSIFDAINKRREMEHSHEIKNFFWTGCVIILFLPSFSLFVITLFSLLTDTLDKYIYWFWLIILGLWFLTDKLKPKKY